MSEENQPVAAVETTPPTLGFIRVFWGVITRPKHTFELLRASGRRTWLVMVLLAVILVILPALASGPIQARQAQETFLAVQEQFADQTGSAPGEVVVPEGGGVPAFISSPLFTTLFPALGSIIGLVLGWLLWGGVLHLLSSLSGGRNTFMQMIQVVIWAWLPYGIRNLLQAIYIAGTGALIANPGLSGFAGPTPAVEEFVFTPPPTSTLILRTFLGQIDMYLFWNLALLATGVMVMAQVSRRKAWGMVCLIWAVFTLIRLIPPLVTGALPFGG